MNTTFTPWRWLAGAAIACLGLTACDSDEVIVADAATEAETTSVPHIAGTNLTAANARSVADAFNASHNGNKSGISSRSEAEITTLDGTNGNPLAYIVNYPDGGWTVVSATKTYYPILAYSETGRFSLENQTDNVGLAIWVDEISHAIESSDSLDEEIASQIALDWLEYEPQALADGGSVGGNTPEAIACRNRLKQLNDTYYTDGWSFTTLSQVPVTVPNYIYNNASSYNSPESYTIIGIQDLSDNGTHGPLTTTCWAQWSHFNDKLPMYNATDHYYAGCGVVAIAQIMKYHRFPATFDWDAMPNYNYGDNSAIQDLILDVFMNVSKTFSGKKTNVNINDAAECLRKYGYKTNVQNHDMQDAGDAVLSNNPVYMRGVQSSSDTGHAWVADGVEYSYRKYNLYVEYLTSNNTYDNYALTSLANPIMIEYQPTYTRFHYNWGEGNYIYDNSGIESGGWYLDGALPDAYNFNNSRKDILITK